MLNGGNWTLCPISDPTTHAKKIGPEIVATVPATVLSSYRNAGALPDPNYDDNLSMISESFFNRDFLYKRTFNVPSKMLEEDRRVLLNFDGINWKAIVVLNGKQVGKIEGAFTRGQFDITDYIKDGENELCVYVQKNANPGARKTKTGENTSFNGGVLGGDNPTFHATIGWDWITTIPGREVGIWNDVYLTSTREVTISDPLVNTSLSDGKATMTPSVFVKNHLSSPVQGTLHGFIGDIRFDTEIKNVAEDYLFWVTVLKNVDKMSFVNLPLIRYRINLSSITHRVLSFQKFDDHFCFIEKFIKLYSEKEYEIQKLIYNECCRVMFNILIYDLAHKNEERYLTFWEKYFSQMKNLHERKILNYSALKLKNKVALYFWLKRRFNIVMWILNKK
jgi:hypothetical protein